jgi:hypothetical protein
MTRPWLVAAVVIVSLVGVGHAFAQLPALIPRQVLFGNPERVDPQISPDGKYLAYRAPDEHNVLQVWMRVAATLKSRWSASARARI